MHCKLEFTKRAWRYSAEKPIGTRIEKHRALTLTRRPKSMSSSKITHSGIVEDISEECIKVRIVQSSSCIGCKIAGHCSTSERKDKIIDVYNVGNNHGYAVGDEVTVSVSSRSGIEAVTLAFTVPFVLLILTVFLSTLLTSNEAASAFAGIIILVPYYIVLYMLRDKVGKRISCAIEE